MGAGNIHRQLLRAARRRCALVAAAVTALAACSQLVFAALSAHGSSGFTGTNVGHKWRRRNSVAIRATATAATPDAPCPLTGRSSQDLLDKSQQLLREVVEVAMSTGPELGLKRTMQAAQAVALTAADIVREPPTELNEAFVANRLRRLFQRLGPTYVKLGQFIASSPTVFPADYVREFQQCLDSAGSVPFSDVKRIIEEDLGRPVSEVFSNLDAVPLAAASIAQVHAATLSTGEDVVVKVQKPGIVEVLKTDLGFIYLASRVLEFINPDLNIRGSIVDIASDLRMSMLGELDFGQELRNLEVFREFLIANELDAAATAPRPYANASSRRVLTMERLRGVPLVDLDGIRKYSADPEATLVTALNVWALSVQRCEFFHADVHAGNLMVLEDGRVGFLDFGIVGRLPPAMSTAIDDLNVALARQDSKGMANALISMGATIGDVDEEAFAQDIEKLLQRLGSTTSPDGAAAVDESQIQEVVLDIAQVAGNNGLKLPREFGLLIKQSLYFDRYTQLLAPGLNMATDSRIAGFAGGPPAAGNASMEVQVVKPGVTES